MKLEYTKTGSLVEGSSQAESNVPKNFDPSMINSPPQTFGNQPTRNPFGQSPTSSFSTPSSNQPGNKKSLFEMMQEQKMQQQQLQLQAQATGMNFQTPQMTGFQQPSMTGYNGQGGSSFF